MWGGGGGGGGGQQQQQQQQHATSTSGSCTAQLYVTAASIMSSTASHVVTSLGKPTPEK